MAKYLDETGLAYFWAKIKEKLSNKADTSSVPTKTSDLTNDIGFITAKDVPDGAAASTTTPKMDGTATVGSEMAFARGDHIHPTDTSRLATNGDAKDTTVTFTAASSRDAIATGEKLSVMMGKIAKYLADFGSLAFKSTVTKADLTPGVQASLEKADSALQSFTETDPTVPAWAKAASKPSYTASEVGALPSSTHIPSTVAELTDSADYAKKSDLTNVYKYNGSVETVDDLPGSGNTAGDVYNVEATDMNYAWNGTAWDPLGQIFSIARIENKDIDTVVSA